VICKEFGTHGVLGRTTDDIFVVRDLCLVHAQALVDRRIGWNMIGPIDEDFPLALCAWNPETDEVQ
jgi:hypothetical protein